MTVPIQTALARARITIALPTKIEISNPLPNGMRYTSPERAASFCRRGMAEMYGGKLRFTLLNQVDRSEESEFARNRGGMLYWNGSDRDPCAMHRPGEVVS